METKNYELTNHLGNVNAVITDRKVLDPDYSHGIWYEFTGSTPTWTTASGTPTVGVSSGTLVFGTSTATAASAYRTEATAGSKTYTFSLDIVYRTSVSDFSVELYKNNTNDLVTPTLLKTFISSELVNGTTIHYTYTTATSGDDYFVYKLVKTSTETAQVRLDNLKFTPANSRYKAVVIMKADYYPFGMVMPGRKWNNGDYRYGYNGMELDNEVKGNGNSYTTEFRQYDPRLGRWMSLDPMMADFPWQSPYAAFDNNPILFTDPMGLAAEGGPEKDKNGKSTGQEMTEALVEPIEEAIKNLPEVNIKDYKKPKPWKDGLTFKKMPSMSTNLGKNVDIILKATLDASLNASTWGLISAYSINNYKDYSSEADRELYLKARLVADGALVVAGVNEMTDGGALMPTGLVVEGGGVIFTGIAGAVLCAHGTGVVIEANADGVKAVQLLSSYAAMNDSEDIGEESEEPNGNNGSSDGNGNNDYKKAKSGVSGKEGAKDVPDWAKGNKPLKKENGDKFAKRLLDAKYGKGNWKTGPKTEYNQIKKWGDRSFE